MFKKTILPLGSHDQQEYWSDLRAGTGTLFFLDRIQTQHSRTQLQKEGSLFFAKGIPMARLVTAGVTDDVARMPSAPQELDNVEEPMQSRPAAHKDPSSPDHIVLDQHRLHSVRGIPRVP